MKCARVWLLAVLGSVVVLFLAGCQPSAPVPPPPMAAPWDEQFRIATAAAIAKDPAAVLAEVRTTELVTETFNPAAIVVIMMFRTSDTDARLFRYRSTDPAGTIEHFYTPVNFLTPTGAAPPGLSPAAIAAIQRSPVEVIQATWDEGKQYLADTSSDPTRNTVRVELITDRTVIPSRVGRPVVWKVVYMAAPTGVPVRIETMVFWVDPTSGEILSRQEVSDP